MKNSKEIFRDLLQQITLAEDREEIQSILYLAVEQVLGLSKSDIISDKSVSLNGPQQKKLEEIITRINAHEPIQYILGEAWFYGRKFKVTPAVLIPRPETELLIEEALNGLSPSSPGTIVDIGTGSGCIAITLAKELFHKKIIGIDVSNEALKISKENAYVLNASVDFQQVDVLRNFPFQGLEMIVSNPPYVTLSEKDSMKNNVLDYEPHLALFVSEDDPLIFYKVIAQRGCEALIPGGKVVVEINERLGKEVADLFHELKFRDIKIIKDLQNKERIVSAIKL